VRVRHAGGNAGRARLRPEEWLLIEWPTDEAEPLKYFLSNLPAATAINDLVATAHMRWRIERDYQDLKQELGLGHYEGRGWRGFHHHASLTIAAYGFVVAERLATGRVAGAKKKFIARQVASLPADYIPRGSPARAAARGGLDRHAAPRAELRTDLPPRSMSTLSRSKRKTTFVTQ
jgi:SRSO17 transposase